jgi:hypothetical protein
MTSGRIRCSKGTPLIKKSNPSLFIKGGTTKEEKNKSLDIEKNIWPWVPMGLDARSDCAGFVPAVRHCSALPSLFIKGGTTKEGKKQKS